MKVVVTVVTVGRVVMPQSPIMNGATPREATHRTLITFHALGTVNATNAGIAPARAPSELIMTPITTQT